MLRVPDQAQLASLGFDAAALLAQARQGLVVDIREAFLDCLLQALSSYFISRRLPPSSLAGVDYSLNRPELRPKRTDLRKGPGFIGAMVCIRMKRLTAALLAAFLAFVCSAGVLAAACPPEGDGGDVILNRLKNRASPPPAYQGMDVEQFLAAFTPNLHTPKYRDKFSWAHNRYVERHEQQGVALVGYILGAKQSGPESCNCHDPTRRDFHVWIGQNQPASRQAAGEMRAGSVVVEPTPAGQESHPNWRLRILRRLAADGAEVRISGWAMYDPEHPDQLGKTRGTLWEVHPVTRIEVWSGGEWREL